MIAEANQRQRRFRAMFIVPTVPLVEQQRRQLHDQLAHLTPVLGLQAADAAVSSRTGAILAAGVSVMTAQIAV